MICKNITTNAQGHLCFAGRDTTALAAQYGTPLYLLDTQQLRENCRIYKQAMQDNFGDSAMPLYASKALCIKEVYRLLAQEGIGIDVVSCGEIYTALAAQFPLSLAYFHGNNKTDADIAYAMECGVGCFVCDNAEELHAVSAEAQKRAITQKVLLRLAPGIDPHTHKAIATGSIDSKFGAAIATGQAKALTELALSLQGVDLWGYHCHIGSQIFDRQPFLDAAEMMLAFCAQMKKELGFTARELNLGGGMGVPYTEADAQMDYADCISQIAQKLKVLCLSHSFPMPQIRMEPGRSMVANAGMTLYTVGTVKTIPSFKSYVSVDGGMGDNPRYALYQSAYTIEVANRMNEPKNLVCTVAGHCCESGDLLAEGIALPHPQRGDILAVCTTGAYNYAMSSNYNRFPRPMMVALDEQQERIIVRRESLADLVKNDI